MQAFNGRDGRPLWPAPPVVLQFQDNLLWPRPAVGDLDGDGVPEIVVTTMTNPDLQRGGHACEVVVLDGRRGRRKWARPWTPAGYRLPNILPPLLVNLDGDGRRTVCLGLWEETTPQLAA